MLYRKPRNKEEPLEFVGVQPRNRHIDEMVRKVGYIGVMFNNDDFFDAVIWASNLVDEYEKHFDTLGDRVAIPFDELGDFKKAELIDAYLLLIVYYYRKGNFRVLESLKSRFMTVAKFQNLPKEHVSVMRNWDDYMADVKKKMEQDDYSAPDIGDLGGTEDLFEYYKGVVEKEQQAFKDEMRKEKGLRVD
ncbi:hypothetical protein LJC31_00165 [Synergistaceae bacterium OttesenSCG-928-I11]|nr:hypothetical protein [Synergistaceae bacterium OttesenSCG-928-I11]